MPPSRTKNATTGRENAKGANAAQNNAEPTKSSSLIKNLPASTPNQDVVEKAPTGSTKPDKSTYDAEQEAIKAMIDALQVKLSTIRDKISLATKSGPSNDRRSALRAELETLRGQQSDSKSSRGKILEQLKSLQDGIQKKVKDLQAAKSKTPFKTVADIDAHISNLDKQVESGNMKLVDEKRALQEISQCKRARRNVEAFQADQEAIEADRAAADELRKQLDDPESKAASERFDAIKAELDELKKEGDEAYADRAKLFEERDEIQAQLNTLFNKKRESAQNFRDANDRYYAKVHEDRARRIEKDRTRRAAEEAQKKLEIAERLREEASAPAFQSQIEDCQTLIDYFSGKSSTAVTSIASAIEKVELAGVPKLELRKVEAVDGLVPLKKKGEDDEPYFVGKKAKGRGKKGTDKIERTSSADGPPTPTTSLQIPLATLVALSSLSIPSPASSSDIPRLIEDLKTKKTWLQANQARVTAENVAKAEADIRRLTKAESTSAVQLLNGGGEHPPEPTHTPQVGDVPSVPVPSQEVVDKLQIVKEHEEVA